MPKQPDDEYSKQALCEELERLNRHDVVLRGMLTMNVPRDRDTYIGVARLDLEDAGAEQEVEFRWPFQRDATRK